MSAPISAAIAFNRVSLPRGFLRPRLCEFVVGQGRAPDGLLDELPSNESTHSTHSCLSRSCSYTNFRSTSCFSTNCRLTYFPSSNFPLT